MAQFSLQISENSHRKLLPSLKLQLWDRTVCFTLHVRNTGFINRSLPPDDPVAPSWGLDPPKGPTRELPFDCQVIVALRLQIPQSQLTVRNSLVNKKLQIHFLPHKKKNFSWLSSLSFLGWLQWVEMFCLRNSIFQQVGQYCQVFIKKEPLA